MPYRYTQKTCAICSNSQRVLEYCDDPNDDYENFLHYSNFEIQVCSKCGYTAKDIQNDVLDNPQVNTKEYEKAKNFGYIPKDLLEQYPYIFESYPANEYNAMAVCQKQNGNYQRYMVCLFASVLQCMTMAGELKHELQIEGDDLTPKETSDYKTIIQILEEEIKNKCQKIVELNIKEILFDHIIYTICLKILQNNKEFDANLQQITPKISQKLKDYILEF